MQSRREFLDLYAKLAAGYGLLCGTPLSTEASPSASQRKRGIVVGAGCAGLAAAQQLQVANHQVVLLEARQRLGGRIWTSRKWNDLPIDLGASWIHGTRGNPLTNLADKIQAKRWTTSYDRSITYASSGKPLSAAQEEVKDEIERQISRTLVAAQSKDRDRSVQAALAGLLGQYPSDSEQHQLINFVINSELEQEYSGSAAMLSAHWFDHGKSFKGDDAIFANGFQVLIEHLAAGMHIELGQIVKEIVWDERQVRVLTETQEFAADYAIVTLPLGVLKAKKVQFTPELPSAMQLAIEKLGFGVLNKCYLRFPKSFWPNDVDWLEYIPQRHGEWAEWVSFLRVAGQPILLGFNAANQGKEIESLSDQAIVKSAMVTLQRIFGSSIPEPTDHQITRWESDPFSLGSYSFNAVGSTPKMRTQLTLPLQNKLFFAGEATEADYPGTVHGAYLSGIRAAKQILAG